MQPTKVAKISLKVRSYAELLLQNVKLKRQSRTLRKHRVQKVTWDSSYSSINGHERQSNHQTLLLCWIYPCMVKLQTDKLGV